MYFINDLFHNGSLWALIATIIYIYKQSEPLLKSHVRNNHEKSLLACSNRIVALVAPIADASPIDRKKLAINDLNEFAAQRKIPLTDKTARSFLSKAKADFINNGGHFAKPQSINLHVQSNGVVKEDENK